MNANSASAYPSKRGLYSLALRRVNLKRSRVRSCGTLVQARRLHHYDLNFKTDKNIAFTISILNLKAKKNRAAQALKYMHIEKVQATLKWSAPSCHHDGVHLHGGLHLGFKRTYIRFSYSASSSVCTDQKGLGTSPFSLSTMIPKVRMPAGTHAEQNFLVLTEVAMRQLKQHPAILRCQLKSDLRFA